MERWRTTALLFGLAGWLAGGCLYRVPVAQTPDGAPAPNSGPPVTIEAAAALTTPVPDTPTAVPPAPTAVPTTVPTQPQPAAEEPATPTPVPTESPTAEDPVARNESVTATPPAGPTPTPIAPITHRFVPGDSLNAVVGRFLSERLNRRVTEDEVRTGTFRVLDDPANADFRPRPSLVYPNQVVVLTNLITYTEEIRSPGAPNPTETPR